MSDDVKAIIEAFQDLMLIENDETRLESAKSTIAKIHEKNEKIIKMLEYLVVSDEYLAIKKLAFKKMRQIAKPENELKEYYIVHYISSLKREIVIEYGKKMPQNASCLVNIEGQKTLVIFPDYIFEKIKRGLAVMCEVIRTPYLKESEKRPIAFFKRRIPFSEILEKASLKWEIHSIYKIDPSSKKEGYEFSSKYKVNHRIARPLSLKYKSLIQIQKRYYLI